MHATLTSNTLRSTITALCMGLVIGLPSLGNGANLVQPDLTAKKVFVATPPYAVLVNGVLTPVNILNKPRTFDLVSNAFINPASGVADAAYLQAWVSATSSQVSGAGITNAGIPGHIEKAGTRLMVRSVAGDQPVGGKCKAELGSYPMPNRKKVYWDTEVQLGSTEPGKAWALTKNAVSPTMIMQVKADDGVNPSLSIVADTDSLNPARLALSFNWRGGKAPKTTTVGRVNNISPNVPVRIVMEAYLDERETANGGQGYWRAWVNGALAASVVGPTLSSMAKLPHDWRLDAYMANDPCPNDQNRVTYWSRAKILVD